MAVVSGGTTLIDNGALDPAVPSGKLVLLSTQTASSSATLDFTSGIDSTYDSYVFKFINIHPANDNTDFLFQGSTDSGSSYGVTITSTFFRAVHDEADTTTALSYRSGQDLAQSTSFQTIFDGVGNDNDQSFSGNLKIFNPSSSVFVKHFIINSQGYMYHNFSANYYSAGYFNDGSNAINGIQFKMNSGNIDAGDICLYGIA